LANVYLVEGPVGAGKSTFANRLSHRIGAPHLNLDAWMANLFLPDRPSDGVMEWYMARKARCIEQIWQVARGILDSGSGVILELGLIQRENRQAFYRRIEALGYGVQVYVLETPRDVRKARVQRRNSKKGDTFSMVVPDEVFEMASDMWQPPDDLERQSQAIEFVSSTG